METPEQKQLVLGLLGSVYGQAQQLDQFIVGESPQLRRGVSQQVKQQFEQVLRQPIQPKQDEVVFQPQSNTIMAPTATVEAVQDKLVAVLEKISSSLEKLVNYLILKEDDQEISDQESA